MTAQIETAKRSHDVWVMIKLKIAKKMQRCECPFKDSAWLV